MLLETTCYHMYGYKSLLPNGNKTLYSWDSIMVPKWSTADNKRDPKYLWNTVLFTELSQTCSSLLNGSHTGQIPAWSQEQPAKQPATHFCWVLSEFLAGLGRIPNLSASGSSQAPGIWTAADSLSNKSTVRSSWEVEIRISLRWSLPYLADCTSLLSLSWGGQHWCHKQDPAGLETSRCNKAESKALQGSVPLSDSVSPPIFRLGTDNALMMCCRKAKESTLPASVDLHSKAISLIHWHLVHAAISRQTAVKALHPFTISMLERAHLYWVTFLKTKLIKRLWIANFINQNEREKNCSTVISPAFPITVFKKELWRK